MILRNSIFKITCYALTTLLVFLTIPIIIDSLGVEVFGVIGIVTSFVSYLTIITNSFSSSVSRNLIFLLNSSNFKEANKEFNSVLFLIIIIGVVVYPFLYYSAESFASVLNISDQSSPSVIFLVRSVFFVFFVSSVAGIFGSVYVIRDRYDLQSISDMFQKIILNMLVITLLIYWDTSLYSYSVALLISSLFIVSFNSLFFYRLLGEVKVSPSLFSTSRLSSNLSLSWWLMINQIGALLYHQSSLILVGIFVGVAHAGFLAISLTISSQVRVLATLISSVFQTKMIRYVANENDEQANDFFLKVVMVISVIVVLVCSLFLGGSKWVLSVWLGKVDPQVLILCIICTSYLPIILNLIPTWSFLLAKNDVSFMGKITFINGILNVVVSVILLKTTDMGVYAAIIPFITLLLAQNLIIVPLILKKHKVNIVKLYKIIVCSAIATLILTAFVFVFFKVIEPQTLIELFLVYLFILLILLFLFILYSLFKFKTLNLKLSLTQLFS